MDGKTDYMEQEQGKARVGAQLLYIYTLYIQQTDVFLANKDIINLEGGAQESSDWTGVLRNPGPGH